MTDFQRIIIFMAVMVALGILLFTTGCRYTCDVDWEANGLEVCTNGKDISPHLVAFTIQVTEEEYNKEYDKNIDLTLMLYKHEIRAEWIEEDSLPKDRRGQYEPYSAMIFIEDIRNSREVSTCTEQFYVLGHELLHFIVDHGPNIPGPEHGHKNPGMWRNTAKGDSVEWKVHDRVWKVCKTSNK